MATVEKNLRLLNIVILQRTETIRIGWKWIFYACQKERIVPGKRVKSIWIAPVWINFFGIILPDSCLMECIGTIAGVVMLAGVTTLSFSAVHS
jgi:hypothetical protein